MRTYAIAAGAFAVAATIAGATPALAVQPSPATTVPFATTAQLSGSLSGANAGAGQYYVNIVLTNISSSTCRIHGYPGVSVLDATGKQIGPAATYVGGATADTIILTPGQSASDTIHTGLGSGTGFREPTSTDIRVYPPGNTVPLVFPAQLTIGDHVFTVTPLAAGSSGNPAGTATVTAPPTKTPTPGKSTSPSTGPSTSPPTSPSTSPSQVPVVPSGAPNTGVPPTGGSATDIPVIAAAVAGAVVLSSGAALLALRRRSRGRS